MLPDDPNFEKLPWPRRTKIYAGLGWAPELIAEELEKHPLAVQRVLDPSLVAVHQARAKELHEAGFKLAAIAAELGVVETTVKRWIFPEFRAKSNARRKALAHTPEGKEYMRRYRSSPEYLEKLRARRKLPEQQEKQRERQRRRRADPEYRARERARANTPAARERRRGYQRKWKAKKNLSSN